jgi:4-carboxymuconolactone decarboxylase
MSKIVQTAGRNALGEFAPEFAHFNDDVLFGENWNDQSIDIKTRCIITVVALMSQGITDSSLIYHLQNAKANGVSRREIVAIITHTAFYAGWPKAWAVFNLAKTVWTVDEQATEKNQISNGESASAPATDDKGRDAFQKTIFFPIGEKNPYGKYFVGQSYLAPVCGEPFPIHNVTFEPGCRNNWHIHHADKGGGQLLICVGGRGWYQEWGKEAVEMTPGKIIEIPEGAKHWHGAAPDSWFSHLAFEIPGENASNEWLEPVAVEEYEKLK